jgi:hypothetical protein
MRRSIETLLWFDCFLYAKANDTSQGKGGYFGMHRGVSGDPYNHGDSVSKFKKAYEATIETLENDPELTAINGINPSILRLTTICYGDSACNRCKKIKSMLVETSERSPDTLTLQEHFRQRSGSPGLIVV